MYFLDTNTIIDYLRGHNIHIRDMFRTISPKNLKIPSIVKAELMVGKYDGKTPVHDIQRMTEFISTFEIVQFGDEESEIYGRIRAELESEGKIIGPNDMIIASTVLAHGGVLVTNNTKEFNRVKGLRVEDWRK